MFYFALSYFISPFFMNRNGEDFNFHSFIHIPCERKRKISFHFSVTFRLLRLFHAFFLSHFNSFMVYVSVFVVYKASYSRTLLHNTLAKKGVNADFSLSQYYNIFSFPLISYSPESFCESIGKKKEHTQR